MTDFLKNIKCRTILIISFFIYLFYVIFKINILNNYNNKYNVVHKYVNTVKESLMNTGKNMVVTKNTNIDDGNKEEEREAELKRLELKYKNYVYTTYDSFILFNRDIYKLYDEFFSENVKCIREKGVSIESLKSLDFNVLPTDHHELINPHTNIDVGNIKSPEDKRLAVERVDKTLLKAHKSYHQQEANNTKDAFANTMGFYDFATWGMQRWSGLQGYHYGIFDPDCACNNLPCAMANLFIHIIAGFDGKGARVLDSGCGWAPLGRLLTYKYDDLFYSGITSSDKGVGVARNFTIDFHFDKQSKIIKTDFIKILPFKDGSFDAVFNIESLFHHPHQNMYLQEVSRILDHKGEFRVLDYFIPTTLKDLKKEDQTLCQCVSDYWGYAKFPEYPDFEQSANDAGLIVKHRYDLYEKIRPFAVSSLYEDVEEIERYISAVANKHYDLKGLFSKKAFDEGGNLHFVELQNLSEILGSKCNSLLLANGVLHYTMYVLTKP